RIEKLALIARAVIGENRDDGVARTELPRQTDRAGDVDAAGAAETQAFLLQQFENQRQSFLVRNLESVIDRRANEISRHAALANAFGDGVSFRLQFAGLDPGIDRRT